MILKIITVLLTLAVTFGAPLVAYPFSGLLKRARQVIDDKLQWDGPDADKKEVVEDRVTHASVVLVSIVVFVLVGLVYMWYVQTYTYAVNPWMYRLVQFMPVVGNSRIGYYDTLPAVYWTALFWFAYVRGRRDREKMK